VCGQSCCRFAQHGIEMAAVAIIPDAQRCESVRGASLCAVTGEPRGGTDRQALLVLNRVTSSVRCVALAARSPEDIAICCADAAVSSVDAESSCVVADD
jgi:hypothetical protein